MKNMAGGLDADSSSEQEEKVRNFLKTWVLSLGNEYAVNGTVAEERDFDFLFKLLIKPWLSKSDETISYNSINSVNWEQIWSEVNLENLLINAPFKLTAIVNRMDLRGNGAYGNNSSNSGETRFIYSLISAYNYSFHNNENNIGNPPFHIDVDSPQKEFLDWQGMNVILEYGNVETEKCDIIQGAKDWVSLSSLSLDDSLDDYLANLEILTNTVTSVGAMPTNPNGSAINQVRSNEKVLATISPNYEVGWDNASWTFRQFELNNEGWLVNAPVSNVPLNSNNFAPNIHIFNTPTTSTELIDWIYGINQNTNKKSILVGNHTISEELLAPDSEMTGELLHYFGIDYWNDSMPSDVFDKLTYNGESAYREKMIRRQISLNTCGGCHGAETKTAFTMIRPLGYGQEANYWDAIPATTTGEVDSRFYNDGNIGYTFDDDAQEKLANYEHSYYTGYYRTLPNVSPFLTGRNFRGADGMWQDDAFANLNHPDNQLNSMFPYLHDSKLTGLFYVNDPSNAYDTDYYADENTLLDNYLYPSENINDYDWWAYDGFPQRHNSNASRHGFNALELRKNDLCRLAHSCCSPKCMELLSLFQELKFVPFPEGGH